MALASVAKHIVFGASLAALPWTPASHGAPYSYGPFLVKPALHYFRHWSDDAINQLLEHEGAVAFDDKVGHSPPTSADHVVLLVRRHEAKVCAPDSPFTLAIELHSSAWPSTVKVELHASELDERGVHHAVLKTEPGRLQYVATKDGRVVFMDPPACAARPMSFRAQASGMAQRRLGDDVNNLLIEPAVDHVDSLEGDKEELLHPHHDELVKECVEVFERTAKDYCKETLKLEVLTATLMMIDGIEVRLHAKISHEKGEPTTHRVRCAFEPTSEEEAMHGVDDPKEAVGQESKGLHATVLMHLDICKSDDVDGVSAQVKNTLKLVELHPMGELSLYKGYRHVYDRLPEWVSGIQMKAEDLPDDHDLRVQPESELCFPGDSGDEVIRDQGTCGSCWAFASATALMTTICVSGQGTYSLESLSDRYEVSVQRIISCNKYKYGCEGGHALAAADSFQKILAALDTSVPYMCGGGDALKHFEVESGKCDAYPWGGSTASCDAALAKAEWKYHNLLSVSGEAEMMKVIFTGHGLYTGMRVYPNFFHPTKTGVYNKVEGSAVGAHAIVLVGYGVLNGEKYWVLQNSWGPKWCDHGFVKILRGTNLAEIESKAVYFDAAPLPGGEIPKPTPMERFTMIKKKQPIGVIIGGAFAIGVSLFGSFFMLMRCIYRKAKEYRKLPSEHP